MNTMVMDAPTLQGVSAPNIKQDARAFFGATRKMAYAMKPAAAIAGLGNSDSVPLRQTGVIAGLIVRVSGTIAFGGTITGTVMSNRWPYNLVKALRLSANGQSNLINCNGLYLKVWEFIQNTDLTDRGVTRPMGALSAVNQGTLSKACENWGTITASPANQLGPGFTVPAIGTYDVDIDYFVPVAADQTSLIGALFAQSSATALQLEIDWAPINELRTLGGSATDAGTALSWSVTGVVYTVPIVGGHGVVPDLSKFHQLTQFRPSNAFVQGENEINLVGVGANRMLMRVGFVINTGAGTGTPLPMTAGNYGPLSWRYGGNDTPETYPNGQVMRSANERMGGSDFGRYWGVGIWDFVSQFAPRDIVDMGSTSDLRLVVNLVNTPTTPYGEVIQETLFASQAGA